MTDKEIMNRVREHYQYLLLEGYDVVYVSLYGSQNYGLDIDEEGYKSDIDTKAVVLPTFEDFVYGKKPVSKVYDFDDGQCDVKDIRLMFECYKKQNVNFIETLFTKYISFNENYYDNAGINLLIKEREKIARLNIHQAIRCMAGMSKEKLFALEHPFPSIKDKIDKYGYDPKQLHHIVRLNDVIGKYVSGRPYEECLIPTAKEYLKRIKKGVFSLKDARKLALDYDTMTQEIKKSVLESEPEMVDVETIYLLDDIKYQVLKRKFKHDLGVDKNEGNRDN